MRRAALPHIEPEKLHRMTFGSSSLDSAGTQLSRDFPGLSRETQTLQATTCRTAGVRAMPGGPCDTDFFTAGSSGD